MRSFLKKAENFNLSQSTNLLHKSFLRNRTQCVKLGFDLSDKTTINHGVPHENLFFLLYVNNFMKNWKVKTIMFNLRMTLVFYLKLKSKENIPLQIYKNLLQTDKYLTRESTQFNCR